MRTTLKLDPDVAAEVERLRREQHLGLSEAVNRLVRAGITANLPREKYVHRPRQLGLQVDVSNIGEALELLDG
jgi:Arc/MetJ family transcription regulator